MTWKLADIYGVAKFAFIGFLILFLIGLVAGGIYQVVRRRR